MPQLGGVSILQQLRQKADSSGSRGLILSNPLLGYFRQLGSNAELGHYREFSLHCRLTRLPENRTPRCRTCLALRWRSSAAHMILLLAGGGAVGAAGVRVALLTASTNSLACSSKGDAPPWNPARACPHCSLRRGCYMLDTLQDWLKRFLRIYILRDS